MALSLTDVLKQHQRGHLKAAEKGYLALLRQNPNDMAGWDSLGMLYAEQHKEKEAIACFQAIIRLQPNQPIAQLHLASTLKWFKRYAEAKKILQDTIERHPDYAPAYNNLGAMYFAEDNFSLAEMHYEKATQLVPDYIDAYYNLGLSLVKQQKLEKAVVIYQTLLTLSPHHAAARFHLACLLMRQEKLSEAIQHFLVIIQTEPHHVETQTNLATCYLKQGQFIEAKQHYTQALTLAPNDTHLLFNLGVTSAQLGELNQAIRYYQKTLQIHSEDVAAHQNLAVLLLAKQHPALALQHFQEVLRLQPDNTSIRYLVDSLLQQSKAVAAPVDYIKNLFDSYATHYESHLVTTLHYQIPDQFLEIIRGIDAKPNSLDILDLGCGTGLCGEKLKLFASSLSGVDLSENMLAIAAEKKLYDTLACDTILSFLAGKNACYDVILAGDTLVYLGDLAPLFLSVNRALRHGGLFVFNTEIAYHPPYQANPSGRFAHHKNYLEDLATQFHFKRLQYKSTVTRRQQHQPVLGHLYVLECFHSDTGYDKLRSVPC